MKSENNTLKKVILRQQECLELCRRRDLKANVVVTWVPTGELRIGENYNEGKEKILSILRCIRCDAYNHISTSEETLVVLETNIIPILKSSKLKSHNLIVQKLVVMLWTNVSVYINTM